MKRILPLILALVAGMAQADSNSDYRAGSDFARQIQGQGTGSIQSFKPQESIPGYNANPDETKYYGGVTAGGDGGLKNDGTTEWATGETGKTITESFMNKPKDILSPDAPFIQTGRDVVNRADSIVGNTGQQCSAQEISRSEYTNYTCERDLQVEQYCTRTARMELQGSTTWETRTLEYEMSQLPAREVNGQYVVSMTSPVTGEIVDAHYSWSRTYLQKSVPMTITVLGTPLSWNAKYSADASFTPVQKTLTAGVAFTSSHPVRVGNTKFRRHTAMKLRLVVRVKKASYTPYVVWSESCPFSKELGKLTKTECTEAGGNRTLVKDGQSYSMYQSCWAYQLTDYIGYDIMLQYIQELLQQARAMIATGNYPQAVMDNVLENLNQAQQQIAIFQSQVQVQQDALLVVERQMSYMRQQLSARMLSRYQNNYHFGGNSL